MRARLQEIKVQLLERMHDAIPEQGRWLKAVVTGYFAYHAVPTNSRALGAFRYSGTTSPTYGDARFGGEVRKTA